MSGKIEDHFAQEARKCEFCCERPVKLKMCSSCKEVGYCGRECQLADWKTHKPNCGAVAALAAMGQNEDLEQKGVQAGARAHSKLLKSSKKKGVPVLTLSMTAFGMVGPGMPIPAGVPPNFGLKQIAANEFNMGASRSAAGRGNFKGEKSYREYYDDMESNKTQWLEFFDHPDNYHHAEHTCGILGTLATIYRQRGDLAWCAAVLDMEEEVLTRYRRVSTGAPPAQVRCCDELAYKYQIIRYNLFFMTERYDECGGLFRELAAFELKYDFPFDAQNYLFMLVAILKKKPTAAVLQSLTNAEIRKCVIAPLKIQGSPSDFMGSADAQKRVALQVCAKCGAKEAAMAQFKKCTMCKVTFYCGRECQKAHWKVHKKTCASLCS